MRPDDNCSKNPSCVLSELLRSILSLVDYYGRLEADESILSELKLALNRTIERLEAESTAREGATRGAISGQDGSPRKGPYAQPKISSRLDHQLEKRG